MMVMVTAQEHPRKAAPMNTVSEVAEKVTDQDGCNEAVVDGSLLRQDLGVFLNAFLGFHCGSVLRQVLDNNLTHGNTSFDISLLIFGAAVTSCIGTRQHGCLAIPLIGLGVFHFFRNLFGDIGWLHTVVVVMWEKYPKEEWE